MRGKIKRTQTRQQIKRKILLYMPTVASVAAIALSIIALLMK